MKKLSIAKTTFAALSMMATSTLADDTKAPRAIHDALLSLPLVMCAAGDESDKCNPEISEKQEKVGTAEEVQDSGGYATACLALPNEITCTDEVLTKMWTDNGCGTAEDFNYHFKTPIAIAPSHVCASVVELKQSFKPQIK